MPFHKVVFTDIDGTLVDINTAEYGKQTNELIRIMKEKNIPLILTSAKTRLEQNKIREDLGLSDPFIVENGGAIVIPKGYFPDYALKDIEYTLRETQETEDDDRYANHDMRKGVRGMQQTKTINNNKTDIPITAANLIVVEIGRSADHIRTKLSDIRKKYNINFKGVADISIEELSNLASISREQAKRMAQRSYGETILQIQSEDIARFVKYVQEDGMKVIHGGRFFDVTVGTDKGIAVGILKKLFRDKFHNDVTFFGIGDSTNDIPMLNLVDIPILVQRQDSLWVDYGEIRMKNAVDSSSISNNNIIKVKGIGPNGWENAIYKIVLELN
ncbi:MAG TPA: HAD-IIB family hydrolase [Nitrososphaeraceae archaeon]|nr:HAD-IIB family hydrolase [Nitrososphaeraceae archaeon]